MDKRKKNVSTCDLRGASVSYGVYDRESHSVWKLGYKAVCVHTMADKEAGNEAGAKSKYNRKRLSSTDLILLSRL